MALTLQRDIEKMELRDHEFTADTIMDALGYNMNTKFDRPLTVNVTSAINAISVGN